MMLTFPIWREREPETAFDGIAEKDDPFPVDESVVSKCRPCIEQRGGDPGVYPAPRIMMTDGSEGISDELVITFSPGITYENHVIIGELIMCSQSAVKEERGLKIRIAFFDEPVEPGEILLFKSVCLVYVGPERILS